jgi:hypothetical protein
MFAHARSVSVAGLRTQASMERGWVAIAVSGGGEPSPACLARREDDASRVCLPVTAPRAKTERPALLRERQG